MLKVGVCRRLTLARKGPPTAATVDGPRQGLQGHASPSARVLGENPLSRSFLSVTLSF